MIPPIRWRKNAASNGGNNAPHRNKSRDAVKAIVVRRSGHPYKTPANLLVVPFD
jgi:hypothetical protein